MVQIVHSQERGSNDLCTMVSIPPMPREPTQYTTKLAKWCKLHGVTITQLSDDTGLAYRTCHLAFHGYRVEYDTAEIISKYTKGKVPIDGLCKAKPRSEYKPLTG